jgi:hypothetical protein
MSETVYKGVEIVGTSNESFSHAIEVAVRRARATLRNLSWFVVAEQRGGLQQGRLEYQVTLRVYFHLEDAEASAEESQTELARSDFEINSASVRDESRAAQRVSERREPKSPAKTKKH